MGNGVVIHPLRYRGAITRCLSRCGAEPLLLEGILDILSCLKSPYLTLFKHQSLLWMEPDHPIIILRLAGVFLCALPAVRELFQYINDPGCVPTASFFSVCCFISLLLRRAVRMGTHVWLLLATILTELLTIMKWSKGQFTEPFPRSVKWGWGIGVTMLVVYPTVQVQEYSWLFDLLRC